MGRSFTLPPGASLLTPIWWARTQRKYLPRRVPARCPLHPSKNGKSSVRRFCGPNAADIVTGQHEYPSNVVRPGMWYGKILRPPSYGATLSKIDLAPAKAIKDVIVVQDGDFVGVAAHDFVHRTKGIGCLGKNRRVESTVADSQHADLRSSSGQRVHIPANSNDLTGAHKALREAYHVAYVQHVADGAPNRSGRVGRQTVDRLDGDTKSVWSANGIAKRFWLVG